jgi:proton-coupled amino acid transporter
VTAAGTVLLLIGLTLLGIIVAMEWNNPNPSGLPAPVTDVQWSSVPLAFCAILYSYEGINLILPIESSMARPGKFGSVFGSAMVVTAVVFCLVGGLCVAAFGPISSGSVTAFLLDVYAEDNAQIEALLLAANAAVSLSVLVTFPLQLFPCLELMGPWLTNKFDALSLLWASLWTSRSSSSSSTVANSHNYDPAAQADGLHSDTNNQDGIDNEHDTDTNDNDNDNDDPLSLAKSWRTRTILVLLTYTVAIAIPNVQSLISLAGALAGSSTALIIPPALELAWIERTTTTTTSTSDSTDAASGGYCSTHYSYRKLRAYALLAGGFVFMCIGTGASLLDIIEAYTR